MTSFLKIPPHIESLIIDLGYADDTPSWEISPCAAALPRKVPTLHGSVLTVEQGAKFILYTTGASLEGTRFGVAWVSGNRREMNNAEFIKGAGLLWNATDPDKNDKWGYINADANVGYRMTF